MVEMSTRERKIHQRTAGFACTCVRMHSLWSMDQVHDVLTSRWPYVRAHALMGYTHVGYTRGTSTAARTGQVVIIRLEHLSQHNLGVDHGARGLPVD